MIPVMRRLYPRGAANKGICVDDRGAMLGPDCVLISRTPRGYRVLDPNAAAALQKCVLDGPRDRDWLFRQCQRIADALGNRELALAQIYGLHIPIAELEAPQLRSLAIIKAGFNPDEPRIPKGEPRAGEWTGDNRATPRAHDMLKPYAETVPLAGGATGRDTPSTTEAFFLEPAMEAQGIPPRQAGQGPVSAPVRLDASPAAYPGDYHDAFVDGLADYLTAKGAVVIKSVPLLGVEGTAAVADMLVKLPGEPPFIIEVKTGLDPNLRHHSA